MKVQITISSQSAGEEATTEQRELELPAAVQIACKEADGTPTIVAIEFTAEGLKAKVVRASEVPAPADDEGDKECAK